MDTLFPIVSINFICQLIIQLCYNCKIIVLIRQLKLLEDGKTGPKEEKRINNKNIGIIKNFIL